ncbi:MAG: hypothetical protein JWR90_2030 [Marmoricola sp.]|jgi:hypothetical protein|nr:hypothetical protein [Marmoricola sp.]
MDPITGLAFGRIAVGTVSLVSPKLAARLFLLDGAANPALPYLSRMFGSREIALGGLTLVATGDARRRLVQVGVAVDAADALTGLTAAASGAVSKKAGIALAVVAAAAIANGVVGLQD